jgi:site-specific recombinase XerD
MAEISPLRQRMIEDLKIRNLSAETQRSYLHHVSRFSRYFGRSNDKLGLEDVRTYQMHMVERRVSWGSLVQMFSPSKCQNYFTSCGYDAY